MSNEKDVLIKGFYSLFNAYVSKEDDTMNSFQKKGSEIKNGIGSVLLLINKQKAEVLDKMNELLNSIPFTPDEKHNSSCDEYAHLIDYFPKKFVYSTIYNGESYIKTDNGIEESAMKVPDSKQRADMQEYNGLVYTYLDLCVTKIKLEALRKNIQDNKSYKLSIDQVSILGL